MMHQLFEEPLNFGGRDFRRGEILRGDSKERVDNNLICLLGTLTNVGGGGFTRQVLKTKTRVSGSPFSSSYIRGLTDEEIVKFFVEPPY